MVGPHIVLNSRGVLKKAQFLVVAIVAAAVVPTVAPVCLEYDKTQNDWSTVSSFTQSVAGSPLPNLSESVAPGPPSGPADQTDNTTATVTSGGAVKASFTVVAAPPSNQEESKAAEGRAMPDNQARTASQARPESGGFTLRWVLLTSLFSMAIAAIGVFAFVRFRARE